MISAKLQKAIDAEKADIEKLKFKRPAFIDLSMFLEDEEGAGEELAQKVYAHISSQGRQKYSGTGILATQNGGRNNMLGAALQCLLVITPMRNYFLEEKWEEVIPATQFREQRFCKLLTWYFQRSFQT